MQIRQRKLAEKALKDVKSKVVSSNDIIPRTELPFTDSNEIATYRKKYGEKFDIFLAHQMRADKIRRSAKNIAQQYAKKGSLVTPATIKLAITNC